MITFIGLVDALGGSGSKFTERRISWYRSWFSSDRLATSSRVRAITQAFAEPGTTSGIRSTGFSRRSSKKPRGLVFASVPSGHVVSPVLFRATTFSLGMRLMSGGNPSGLPSSLRISR
ncbi:hypothetical protein D3C87_1760940 [compost metagenome]